MAILPLSHAKGVLEISSDRADAAVSAFLAASEQVVKDWCGRQFERVSRVWYPSLSRLGRNDLILPERPVWVVSDVRVDSDGAWGQSASAFPASSALVAGTDYAIRRDSADGLASDSGLLVRLPSFGANDPWDREYGIWPEYDGGVRITYEGGWYPRGGTVTPTMPADIELAVILLLRELWRNAKHGGPVDSETNFGASYQRASDRMASMTEPRRLLAKYREA